MSMLTGPAIAKAIEDGKIKVDPFDASNIQPSSLDLRLGSKVRVYRNFVGVGHASEEPQTSRAHAELLYDSREMAQGEGIDLHRPWPTRDYDIDQSGWLLKPGILYLMHTHERLSTELFATDITGKSSTARIGVQVHLTAGFGDPGFDGQYTLEVTATHATVLYVGDLICQARFWTLEGPVVSYQARGRYVGERALGPHGAAPRKET